MLRKMVNGKLQPYAKGTISNPKCKDHVRKRYNCNCTTRMVTVLDKRTQTLLKLHVCVNFCVGKTFRLEVNEDDSSITKNSW